MNFVCVWLDGRGIAHCRGFYEKRLALDFGVHVAGVVINMEERPGPDGEIPVILDLLQTMRV